MTIPRSNKPKFSFKSFESFQWKHVTNYVSPIFSPYQELEAQLTRTLTALIQYSMADCTSNTHCTHCIHCNRFFISRLWRFSAQVAPSQTSKSFQFYALLIGRQPMLFVSVKPREERSARTCRRAISRQRSAHLISIVNNVSVWRRKFRKLQSTSIERGSGWWTTRLRPPNASDLHEPNAVESSDK